MSPVFNFSIFANCQQSQPRRRQCREGQPIEGKLFAIRIAVVVLNSRRNSLIIAGIRGPTGNRATTGPQMISE